MPKGIKGFQKGHKSFIISAWNKGKKGLQVAWNKDKISKEDNRILSGENHYKWKGGITKTLWNNKEYRQKQLKLWRHKKGISKIYNSRTTKINYSKKQQNQAYKRRIRIGGKLPLARIQFVYEDNIKRFGTLTCYLCLKPVPFGKDTLEHKIPLIRGGSNEYNNLAIACRSCNCKKYIKTEIEYRKEKLKC